jgi:hypothetical protein
MKIKLILTTGKEIELTDQEFEELKNNPLFKGGDICNIPYIPQTTPIYPNNPWNPWGSPIIY